MRRLLLLLAIAAWLLAALPAAAQSVPGNANIGTKFQAANTSTTNQITTGTDAPIGSLIFDAIAFFGTTTVSSVVDSASNCSGYSAHNSVQLGSKRVAFYFCLGSTVDLPVSGTITTTWNAQNANHGTMAFLVTGAPSSSIFDTTSGADNSANGTGTSASLSVTTGVANVLAVSCVGVSGETTGFAESSGYTTIAPSLVNSSNLGLHCATQAVASPTTITYSPSWSGSHAWTAWSMVIKSSGGGVTPKGTLLGVGP
jgi:hypothetical protein